MKNSTAFFIRLMLISFIAFLLLCLLSSCTGERAVMKKDCKGNWHTKQKGGFYL
jgi:hypothetical protein